MDLRLSFTSLGLFNSLTDSVFHTVLFIQGHLETSVVPLTEVCKKIVSYVKRKDGK